LFINYSIDNDTILSGQQHILRLFDLEDEKKEESFSFNIGSVLYIDRRPSSKKIILMLLKFSSKIEHIDLPFDYLYYLEIEQENHFKIQKEVICYSGRKDRQTFVCTLIVVLLHSKYHFDFCEICSSKVESLMILILFINYYRQWSNSLSGQQRSTFFSSTRCRTWKNRKRKIWIILSSSFIHKIILILFFLKLFKQGRMLILNIVLINYYRQWSNFSARAYIVRLPDVKFVIYYIEFKKKNRISFVLPCR